jgi:exodeoxyribonuclease VII small subunit
MPKKVISSTTPNAEDAPGQAMLTFEAAYQELEEIVLQLERGDLPLEQALQLHERGQKLATLCAAQLEQAELKVRRIDTEN